MTPNQEVAQYIVERFREAWLAQLVEIIEREIAGTPSQHQSQPVGLL